MANYEHLPIFKSCYDYIIEIYLRTKNFPKEYKYTIGEKLKSVGLELLLGIHELNSLSDKELKKVLIHRYIKFAEMCKMLIRISKDINIVSFKDFEILSLKNIEILKQLEGWKKYIFK